MTHPTPADVLFDGAQTYDEKNDDYGDSWRLVGEFMYRLTDGEGMVLETPEDFISFGLYTRRLDKIARAFNGEFLSDELNFESVVDSHEDEAVYGAMHSVNQRDREGSVAVDHPTVIPEDE
jgi:hypothetical protein